MNDRNSTQRQRINRANPQIYLDISVSQNNSENDLLIGQDAQQGHYLGRLLNENETLGPGQRLHTKTSDSKSNQLVSEEDE